MKFEFGKFYEHTTGKRLYIVGTADTHMHGKTTIAEDEYGELSAVGRYEDSTSNFVEITKEKFLSPSTRVVSNKGITFITPRYSEAFTIPSPQENNVMVFNATPFISETIKERTDEFLKVMGKYKTEIKVGCIYKHFKGNYYYIHDIVTDSETDKDIVVYQALYIRDGKFKKYTRSLEMFSEEVEKPNYSGPRFILIETKYTEYILEMVFNHEDESLSESYFVECIEACLKFEELLNKTDLHTFFTKTYIDMIHNK